jgi:hypothetical protein
LGVGGLKVKGKPHVLSGTQLWKVCKELEKTCGVDMTFIFACPKLESSEQMALMDATQD